MRGTKMMPSASLNYLLNFSVLILAHRFLQIARVAMPNFTALLPVVPDRACDRRLGTDRREPQAVPAYLHG
jgi:hypothetical protein